MYGHVGIIIIEVVEEIRSPRKIIGKKKKEHLKLLGKIRFQRTREREGSGVKILKEWSEQ